MLLQWGGGNAALSKCAGRVVVKPTRPSLSRSAFGAVPVTHQFRFGLVERAAVGASAGVDPVAIGRTIVVEGCSAGDGCRGPTPSISPSNLPAASYTLSPQKLVGTSRTVSRLDAGRSSRAVMRSTGRRFSIPDPYSPRSSVSWHFPQG